MTAVSRNFYFDPLDDIVNKYNNTFHRTDEIKSIEVNLILMLNTIFVSDEKTLYLKLVIMQEFQNIKTFLLKEILLIGLKKFLYLAKLKMQFHGLILIMI